MIYLREQIELLRMMVLLVGTGICGVIDFRHRRIPNQVVYPCMVLEVLLLIVFCISTGTASPLLQGMGSFLAVFLFYFWKEKRKTRLVGMGDVKLFLLLSLSLPWLYNLSLSFLVFGCYFGYYAFLIAFHKRHKRGTLVPIGTLVFGLVVPLCLLRIFLGT